MNLKSSKTDPKIRKSSIKASKHQCLKKGGRRHWRSLKIRRPLAVVPGGYGVVDALFYVLYFLTLVPQVQYVTLVMDLGPPALPPTSPHSTSFLPRSASLFLFLTYFVRPLFRPRFCLNVGSVLKPQIDQHVPRLRSKIVPRALCVQFSVSGRC